MIKKTKKQGGNQEILLSFGWTVETEHCQWLPFIHGCLYLSITFRRLKYYFSILPIVTVKIINE